MLRIKENNGMNSNLQADSPPSKLALEVKNLSFFYGNLLIFDLIQELAGVFIPLHLAATDKVHIHVSLGLVDAVCYLGDVEVF